MAQHGLSPRQKKAAEPEAAEKRRHNNSPRLAHDTAQVPEDDLLDRLLQSSPQDHAGLLSGVSSEEHRAGIATRLQQTHGNAYVQRVVQDIQRRATTKAPAPAATSVASPEEEEQQAPTETSTESTAEVPTSPTAVTPAREPAPSTIEEEAPAPTAEAPTAATPAREPAPSTIEEEAPAPTAEAPTAVTPAREPAPSTIEEEAPAPTAEATAEAPAGGTETETETRELEPAIEIYRREELARLRARWERWAINNAQRAEEAISRTPPNYHTAGNYIYNVRFEVDSMLRNPRVPDEVKERIRLTEDSVRLAAQTLNTLQRPDEEVTYRISEVIGLVALDYVFGP